MMPKFQYEAQQSDGQVIDGLIEESTVAAAIERLQSAGMTVLSIALHRDSAVNVPTAEEDRHNESVHESNRLLTNLDRLLEHSDPLRMGLEAVASECISPPMTVKVNRLVRELKSKVSAREFLNRVENLEWLPVLVSTRDQESDSERWREMLSLVEIDNRIHSAWRELIYPALVLFASLVVLVILQINIVYPFGQLFQSFGLTLPPPTRLLIFATEVCVRYPWQVTLGLLLASALFVLLIRWWRSRALTTRLFGAAIAGNTSSVRAMSRFLRLLADALCLEATLPQALRLAGRGCGHAHFRDMAARLAQGCEQEARELVESPVSHNFPATMLVALNAAPTSPQTIELLRSLSRMYADRVTQRRPMADGVWGPIALGLVGLFIAFVIFAVFTPLVQMITSLA